MKTILAALRRAPKRAAGLLVLVAAVAVPASLFAWGPASRPTYTLEKPADHVVFNSITNNKKHGDERNFVQIREAGGKYGEEVQLTPGKEYEVYAFYHNNAKSHLNDAAHNYKGMAVDAKMRIQLPGTVKKGEKARITSIISASNAQPKEVWDEAYGVNNTAGDAALRIVPNSAKITNLGKTNGQPLPNELFTTGALLGYDKLDGKVPGCNEFSGYITFRFKVVQPGFKVTKQVSKAQQNKYTKQVAVHAGETVDYKISYHNTGTVQQNNVVIRDVLPKGVSYIPGSTHVSNSTTNHQWKKIADDGVVSERGINLGSYAPNGGLFLKFSAKVTDLAALDCGDNSLVNTAYAQTENGSKQDTATVTVKKECSTPASYHCGVLTAQVLSDTRFKFNTSYEVKGGTFKHIVYAVRDAQGKEVAKLTGKPTMAEYEQTNPGKYTVEATAVFMVDGKEVTASGPKCTTDIVVPKAPTPPAPEKVKVCRLSDKKIVEVEKKELSANPASYSTNLDDCKETVVEKEIEVCDLTTKTFPVKIKESAFDASKHSKNAADCAAAPLEPKKEMCTVPGKEHLPKNSPDCIELPSELPKTGGLDAAALLGLSAMTISLGYYLASRRNIG
ncbi:MAG: hypothetical protein Q4B06_02935 [Candidatus Saccharibacteria bacterium]|nr:hypothetical protein [Candidatus Saccharibacteria bacterium]